MYAGLLPFGENAPGATEPELRQALDPRRPRRAAARRADLARSACASPRVGASPSARSISPWRSWGRREGPARRPPARCTAAGFRASRLSSGKPRRASRAPGAPTASGSSSRPTDPGTERSRIVVERRPRARGDVGSSSVRAAEVVHAVRDEMALKLTDVVLRRTQLGTEEHPGESALKECADLMGLELGVGRPPDRARGGGSERRVSAVGARGRGAALDGRAPDPLPDLLVSDATRTTRRRRTCTTSTATSCGAATRCAW